MAHIIHQPNPKLDLVFERTVDIAPELLWDAWTQPEHLKHWFTPAPWKTAEAEIDLRPGGLFRTVMLSPEGQEHINIGCYLEVIENEKLVWTSALGPGYRPIESPLFITAVVTFEGQGKETKYKAIVLHKDEAGRKEHDARGFQEGWGKALDQLVAYMKTQK